LMWKIMVERDRPQIAIKYDAYCVNKATHTHAHTHTHTHSEYVIFIDLSTATVVTPTCLNVPLYAHCMSC
jgi:hypothetical protein